MRHANPLFLLLLIGACQTTPEAPPMQHAGLPPLGSPRPLAATVGTSIAPFPDASSCFTLPGTWPGELTGCYDAEDRLGGIELDVPLDQVGDAVVAVRDTYAPGVSAQVRAVGGSAWASADGVRLEVIRESTRVHVRARVAGITLTPVVEPRHEPATPVDPANAPT
ncbi:MAG: hypothetical protein Q8P41_23105 [Pseudomonadota bacterium]|nr:hypothetical protein [Pseudomonadota bacterium]